MYYFSIRKILDSLAFKFGSAMVMVVLVAVGGMEAYTYTSAQSSELQHGLNDLDTLAKDTATRIDLSLASGLGLADHLAATGDAQDYLDLASRRRITPGGQRAMESWLDLQARAVRTQGASVIFLMAPDGTCLASSERALTGRNFGFRPYFQEALAGQRATSDWVIGSVDQAPRVFSAAPVRLGGVTKGVLVADIGVEDVVAAMAGIGRHGCRAAVINGDGIILADSDPALQYHAIKALAPEVLAGLERTRQFLGRAIPVSPLPADFVAAFLAARDNHIAQSLRYRSSGASRWGACVPLAERPWVVAVSIPESAILQSVRRAQRRTLWVALAITSAVFLLGFLLTRALLSPLRRLSEAMTRFGAGDASARAPMRVQDERGLLAQTFNDMADRLQAHQENLEERVAARTLELETTLAEVRTLKGMIPICSYCKKIRDDEGGWWQLERYIHDHSEAEFSHGICPDCTRREFPGV